MKNGISLLCPTRGRPENAKTLLESFKKTVKNDNNELWFYIQDDDPKKDDYVKLFTSMNHKEYIVDYFTFTGHMWNRLADESKGDIIMLMGDDCVIETGHWDEIIIKAVQPYSDCIYIVGVVDGRTKPGNSYGSCPFPAMHRKMKDTLGYFYPLHFLHRYGDTYLIKLGEKLGRLIKLNNVLFKHLKSTYAADETGKKSRQWTPYDKNSFEKGERYFQQDLELLKEHITKK
jgi:hypothetical protein